MSACNQLINVLNSKDFKQLLELLQLPEINQLLKTSEVADLVIVISAIFHQCVRSLLSTDHSRSYEEASIFDEIIYECSRLMRNSCAIGLPIQNCIAELTHESQCIFETSKIVLVSKEVVSHKTRKMCWQFVANLGVQNQSTQRQIWTKCIEPQLIELNCVCETENGRECTMILYNLFISELLSTADVKKIVELLLQCISSQNYRHELQNNDFHQLFMEHAITNYRSIVPVYDRITPLEKRLHLTYYIADHMRSVRHEAVSSVLLQFICKEFKKKSDCILRSTNSANDSMHSKEVVGLLDIIAQASSDERYSHVLATDNALFINVGSLLRSIHEIGKQRAIPAEADSNIFAPVQKLNQLAPNSTDDSSIERDISYQLKSMLIRTLANMTYKNKEHQDLARDMEFIMVVLDSTALDARNPMIKEWNIFAIRNLCENNIENQQIIRQLTKVGDSKSDIVNEINLELGSLRINPNNKNE